MSKRTLRVATRSSALALWQAEFIKAELERLHDNVVVELVKIKTQGDKILDVPLAKVGGKGLFVKELEEAMLDGRADLAVHSMKDVPMAFPEGLGLVAICEREDPTDAFVSNQYRTSTSFPKGGWGVPPACPASPSPGPTPRTFRSGYCAVTSTPAWPSWMPANTMPSFWPAPGSGAWVSRIASATAFPTLSRCPPWARVPWASSVAWMIMSYWPCSNR